MYVCVCVCVYVCVCVGMNKCVAWRIHQYERVLHVRCSDAVWHDTHERLCAHHRCVCVCVCVWMSVWHDSYINMDECVTWRIHEYEWVCDMTHTSIWKNISYQILSCYMTWHIWMSVCVCLCVRARVCRNGCVTWLIYQCEKVMPVRCSDRYTVIDTHTHTYTHIHIHTHTHAHTHTHTHTRR